MKVRAIAMGQHGGVMRYPGDIFEVTEEDFTLHTSHEKKFRWYEGVVEEQKKKEESKNAGKGKA